MQAAGTTAKQINVIVCSHMRWHGARLFGEEKVSCPWDEEGVRERAPATWLHAAATKVNTNHFYAFTPSKGLSVLMVK